MKRLVGLFIAFLVGVGGYVAYTSPTLPLGATGAATSAPVLLSPVGAACRLDQGACWVAMADQQARLALSPLPVPTLKPVQLSASLTGFGVVHSVSVVVDGVEMSMGFQQAQLAMVGGDVWQGTFTLPICTNASMLWQAKLDIQAEAGHYQAVVPFVTTH